MPPSAHIAGIPVEETLLSFGPVLLAVLAATTAQWRRRVARRLRAMRRRGAGPGSG